MFVTARMVLAVATKLLIHASLPACISWRLRLEFNSNVLINFL